MEEVTSYLSQGQSQVEMALVLRKRRRLSKDSVLVAVLGAVTKVPDKHNLSKGALWLTV